MQVRFVSKKTRRVQAFSELSFVRAYTDRILFMNETGIYEEDPTAEMLTNPKREMTNWFLSSYT